MTTLSILLTLLLPGLQAETGNILNLLWYLGNLLILARPWSCSLPAVL